MSDRRSKLTAVVDRLQRLRQPVLVVICLLGVLATALLARHTWKTRQEVTALTPSWAPT